MPRKKAEPTPEDFKAVGENPALPACHNCEFYSARKDSTFGVCGVDLPPFLMRSTAKQMQLVNQNYKCVLHQAAHS